MNNSFLHCYKSGILVKIFPLSELEILIGRKGSGVDLEIEDSKVSSRHVLLKKISPEKFVLKDLGSSNGTVFQGLPVSDDVELKFGDSFYLGSDRLKILISSENIESLARVDLSHFFKDRNFLSIGRNESSDLCLNFPSVSKNHAQIICDESKYYIKDLKSANGVFLNGNRINSMMPLLEGDRVYLGGCEFYISGKILFCKELKKSELPVLSVESLKKTVGTKTILNRLDLHFSMGKMFGIMGPSGCGKTTLLKLMNGYEKPSEGRVFLHGYDLNENLSLCKKLIGYVPQEDTVHKELSVYDALFYGSRLRLSDDLSDLEISSEIEKVLSRLRILHIRSSLVRNISGGERKRVCIALELLSDPSILFLDEPTSPLDPQSVQEFLEILKDLCSEGRTVILVTHKPEDLKYLDSAVFLSSGGYLSYFGDTKTYLQYFQTTDTVSVYSILSENGKGTELNEKFLKSSKNQIRSPHQYNKNTKNKKESENDSIIRQTIVLLKRNLKIKINDKINTFLLLIQSPIIAVLLFLIYDRLELSTLFIMVLSSIWFGCNNAAREIVDEFSVYKRERMYNLRIDSYILAKLFLFLIIGCMQIIPFSLIVHAKLPLADVFDTGAFLFFLSCVSVLLGLFLSSAFSTAEKVMSVIPIVLIPQIMFSGVIVKIPDRIIWLSYLTVTRWGMQGISKIQTTLKFMTQEKNGQSAEMERKTSEIIGYSTDFSLLQTALILSLIALIYYIMLYLMMKRKDA